MRVSLRWLEEFVAVDVPPRRLAELLDLSGTKVEAIHKPAGKVEGVVVAEVLEIAPHPNADSLTLVDVRAGDGETARVVCGARNFAVGDHVPFARVGAHLPEMEIGERKIRGEPSQGMLCSAAELALSSDHSGILVLPPDADLGSDVAELLTLDDTVFELEITPNRPDCMSVLGVAREVSALLGNELKVPDPELEARDGMDSPVEVRIEDEGGCPRYLARYATDVAVGPSPAWMAARLLRVGVRPISNVVDVTNYVMFELGQPLHAFDADKVQDRKIIIRRARRGERMTTLDGQERALHTDDLLITDPGGPLAIAGVMGGGDSEVSEATSAVILESAHFDPVSVALTSRRQGLRTEASARFERGSDPEMVDLAAARACGLLARYTSAAVSSDVTDAYPGRRDTARIVLRARRTGQILGLDVTASKQTEYLSALGMQVEEGQSTLEVRVPSFRPDLKREVDLIEEVGRLAGFERLPATLPPGRAGGLTREQQVERDLRLLLVDLGLHEVWTSSFTSRAQLERLGLRADHPALRFVRLENPMSEEEDVLRTTLLPGLLEAAALNQRHGARSTAVFELSRLYEPSGEQLPREATVLACLMTGARGAPGWDVPATEWDLFDTKGVMQAIFSSLRLEEPEFEPITGMPFHPTRAAAVSFRGEPAGSIGELHPDVQGSWDLPERVIAFELALTPLLSALPGRAKVVDLPRFPGNLVDIAVVVDSQTSVAAVQRVIQGSGGAELASTRLFDVYLGDQIQSGKKSLAFALELRHPDRTLPDEEAAAIVDRIVAALSDRFDAKLRS